MPRLKKFRFSKGRCEYTKITGWFEMGGGANPFPLQMPDEMLMKTWEQ